MLKGVALAFLTYALFSSADAIIKGLGRELPVFEIVFFATLFSFVVVLILRPPGERWRDMFRMNHPRRVLLRALCGVIAGMCSVYAFTTIPLAEAYALIFLAPVFVTLLSIPLLGESVGWRRLTAVGVGLAGMVLVVKPGFRELHLGHLAAVVVAGAGAVTIIILRMIGRTERRVSLVGVAMVAALVANGVLMIPEFQWPSTDAFMRFGLIGVVGGIGQVTMMAATRTAPANRVAPAQYSQIVWAVVLGAVFYAEYPDGLALAGILLIGLSGLFTFLREDKVAGWSRRTYVISDRP
jgi:S-adenosylmethionine uptake transporter